MSPSLDRSGLSPFLAGDGAPTTGVSVVSFQQPARLTMLHCSRVCVTAAILCVAVVAAVHAQVPEEQPSGTWHVQSWMGDVTFLSANALLGGLTAGVLQELRGGSFSDGFARGALGGAVAYGGRRIAVGDHWGAGLLGRQVAAVGGSIARNAAEGEPALSRLHFPAGPVWLYVDRRGDTAVRAKVDLHATIWLIAAMADDRLEFDAAASLSGGAPVFHAPHHNLWSQGTRANGQMVGGVIVLGGRPAMREGADVLAHERVHVLQNDFAQALWGDAFETWLVSRLPGTDAVLRFVRPGLTWSLATGLVQMVGVEWSSRPWEIEATFLERR